MSEQYIITISREFGSLGRPIARRMSEILGIMYYDRDIVEEVSKQLQLPVLKPDIAGNNFSFSSRKPCDAAKHRRFAGSAFSCDPHNLTSPHSQGKILNCGGMII